MKVVVVSPYSLTYVGGVQGQVLGLARALRALGVDARVVAPCDGPPPEPGVTAVGGTVRVPSNGSIAPIAAGKAASTHTLEALRVVAPDVVHLHEPLVPGPTQAALIAAEAPLVGTFHASYSEKNRWYQFFRPPLRHYLDRLAVRTAVSDEARREAEDAFGGTYHLLPNGVEVDRYATADPHPSRRPAIFFIGRHEPRKGLAVLLDAFAGLDRDAELWVAGDGAQSEELRARNVPGVEWLGQISDGEKAARLRGATIAAFPSVASESFGVVLLEAMAAGVPAVASDIPGYRSVARPDREALIVPPGDPDALRSALRRLLDDAAQRDRLVEAGRRRADELSMARLAERFVPIYEEAVAAGPAR
ncbi:MAG TPA: glycosyltransferase family 4 protein [Acidimicrobiia bacterium]|nr:glycosyltransferase family 4 protein [Acidimicrobiia bacterium]